MKPSPSEGQYKGKDEPFFVDEAGPPPMIGDEINAGNARALQIGFIWTEPINDGFCRAVAAEFVALVLFLFSTVTVIEYNPDVTFGSAKHLLIALSFGFNIFLLVFFYAGVSGGNINPAVSLALVLGKRMSVLRGVCYIIAQSVGAIVGAAFAKIISIDNRFNNVSGGANILTDGVNAGQAIFGEMLMTFLLCFTVLVGIDPELWSLPDVKIKVAPSFFLALLVTITIGHFVMIPIDGCSINPARSFGPAVVANEWSDHWVFWLGPFMGSVLAVGLWELVFRPPVIKPTKST